MRQESLRNLAILFIKHSIARNLILDVVINTFAEQKAQKRGILIIKILTKNKIVI